MQPLTGVVAVRDDLQLTETLLQALGHEDFIRLCELAGGTRLYVPESINRSVGYTRKRLEKRFGEEIGGRLVDALPAGQYEVPSARPFMCRRYFSQGKTILQIADKLRYARLRAVEDALTSSTPFKHRLLDILGDDLFAELVERHGPSSFIISADKPDYRDTWVQLGEEIYTKIVEVTASRMYLRIPLGRHVRVRYYRAHGLSNAKIAQRLAITESGVDKIIRDLRDAGDLPEKGSALDQPAGAK